MNQSNRTCLWTPLRQHSPAPCNRYKHASCAYEGIVYLLGGREKCSLKDFWKYSVVRDEWTELDSSSEKAPEELEEHTMVAHEGRLYVFGGLRDSAYTGSKKPLWLFDTVQETWESWKEHKYISQDVGPVNRKGHSAVAFGSAMYIYGGCIDMKGSSQEFWKFDFDKRVWSLLSGPQAEGGPGPRHGHAAITHQDSMFLYGGLRGLKEQRDFWKWSFINQTWSCIKAPSGPSKLVGHTANVYNDSVLLYGGGETHSSPKNCLWRFSLSTLTWEKLPSLPGSIPPCRIHHCSVGLGSSFQPSGVCPREIPNTHSLSGKLRPFKNKCFPSNPSTWLEDAIELQALDLGDPKAHKDSCQALKEARHQGNCLTFENKTFCQKWDRVESTEQEITDSLPDLLLIFGGKPLERQATISVWQLTLADF